MRLKKALAGLLAAVLTVTSASFGVYAETAFGEPGGADNSVSTENELYLVQPEAGYLKMKQHIAYYINGEVCQKADI